MAEAAGADTIAAILRRPFVAAELKEGVLAGSTIGWGSPLAQYQTIVTQFEGSLRPFGAFDAMLPLMRRVPLGLACLGIVVIGATGSGVTQASPKPISDMHLAAGDVEPSKAVCIVVVTEELARAETSQAVLADELRAAVATSTDRVFLPGLIDSSTPSIAATGNSPEHLLANLATAAGSIPPSVRSRLVFVLDPLTCSTVSLMPGDEFADMTPAGGSIRGISVVPSDAIERDSSGAQLLLIDASQIAAATASIVLDGTEQATIGTKQHSCRSAGRVNGTHVVVAEKLASIEGHALVRIQAPARQRSRDDLWRKLRCCGLSHDRR